MRIRFVVPCLLLMLAAIAAQPLRSAEVIDGIAAQVGSEIVLLSEILQASGPAEQRILAEGGAESDVLRLREEVLERMIERALIRQVVKRAELSAPDAEVDQAVADIARENQLDVAELRSTVESQGMPFEVYRNRIRGEIEQRKVVNAMVASKVRLDDDEIREIYDREFSDQPQGGEEFYLRQILVAKDAKTTMAQACMKVGAARARVASGEAFKLVASQVSQVNPEVGGAIGWLHESEMASWMREAVGNLEPGEMSRVTEQPFGCNLVEIVERRPYQQITWEKAKDPLYEQVFERKMAEQYQKFIESLREQTYIERKGMFADSRRLGTETGSSGSAAGDF